jgi:hypothetical protein
MTIANASPRILQRNADRRDAVLPRGTRCAIMINRIDMLQWRESGGHH